MPFAIIIIWRQPTDHVSDCYFCLTSIPGVGAKSKYTVQYLNVSSAVRPVPHNVELPVPMPPSNNTMSDSDEDVGQANNNMYCDPTIAGACPYNESEMLTQGELSINHDLNLSKKQAELLGCRLRRWNLLRQECFSMGVMKNSRISSPRMMSCFAMMFVTFGTIDHEYNPDRWGLFIDSSKVSVKVVLLHNGNRFHSIPLIHAASMKETHASMKLLLRKIKYDEFKWNLFSDLKVVSPLFGMRIGYKNTDVPVRVGQPGQEVSLCQ
jgi:hypothetical protein